ncbi:NAD(P)-dependent oxidoreductase [Desulfoluna butyratoxydans]|uniref:Alpha-helical ferredoxin n=1 Tax=Desulfoluna butyratoxydans TaxID=231438 RepID=A0A4U8YHT4_9BACT|nr:NAD(P)-dependent oxidoreductase [Desulfoluna butyratoxydans]VFQ43156.1 alpha-helical ferredoxin [Desulfoluna butyratoxydans]
MGTHVIEEANQCLVCKKPRCTTGCPVSTPIRDMIELFRKGEMMEAGRLLFENNPLSVICSLICPHEKFCEGHCVLSAKKKPVAISTIEQYISSYFLTRHDMAPRESREERVAVIGSGPAGLTVAILMALKGYRVTIFESAERTGGILRYGIPEYRLPKKVLDSLDELLERLSVKVRPNTLIGPVITIDDLKRDGYQSIFIGTGVWKPRPLRIQGESLGHVHYAINYLKNPDVYRLGRRVAIIGAGNVAMDVARTALRKGAQEVTVVYRRSEAEMPATPFEYDYAKVEGVEFAFQTNPVAITDEGLVVESTVRSEDAEGNATYTPDPATRTLFPADAVMIAASQTPQANIVATATGIEVAKGGLVITDDCGRTTMEGVFASGDVVTGAKTVVEAVAFSKRAVAAMETYMDGKAGTP